MMQLYDAQICRVRALLEGLPAKTYAYDESKAWPETSDFQMIFQKDAAYELGAGKATSANLTCVTEDVELFKALGLSGGQVRGEARELPGGQVQGEARELPGGQVQGEARELPGGQVQGETREPPENGGRVRDQILVYGRDLQEIQGDVSYARICEVLVRSEEERLAKAPKQNAEGDDAAVGDPSDSGRILKLLQDIDFVKFHVYGKGFMMRTSGQSAIEQVRVSKKALQDGITFERMGDTMISQYKKNPSVLAVRVSFVTAEAFDYASLQKEAGKAVEIRNSLSKIQKGLPTECAVCDVREICNEVEGLRELHFGKKERAGKSPADSKKVIL